MTHGIIPQPTTQQPHPGSDISFVKSWFLEAIPAMIHSGLGYWGKTLPGVQWMLFRLYSPFPQGAGITGWWRTMLQMGNYYVFQTHGVEIYFKKKLRTIDLNQEWLTFWHKLADQMLAEALGTRTWERRDVMGKWGSEIQDLGEGYQGRHCPKGLWPRGRTEEWEFSKDRSEGRTWRKGWRTNCMLPPSEAERDWGSRPCFSSPHAPQTKRVWNQIFSLYYINSSSLQVLAGSQASLQSLWHGAQWPHFKIRDQRD